MMSDEIKKEFILTDELREKAGKRPVFNILYIGDNDSHLSPFRGESMLRTFTEVYSKQADISYMTATPKYVSNMKLSQFDDINIIWIDNISDFKAAQKLTEIQSTILEEVHPGWKDEVKALQEEEKTEEAVEFIREINRKREDKLRIIYALDEWVWEGPIGRSHDIQSVQLIETYINLADRVITPTYELRDAIQHYKFIVDPNKPISVIASAINSDFFQLYRDFSRNNDARVKQLRDKPKVLIKGVSVPENIQTFIIDNYKKMDITVCSVGEVNDHLMGLMQNGKVKHIYHWANPFVNKSNINATYSIERDGGYDFVISTKPDELVGELYEITSGDEDILFAIAYGALPISGIEHLGFDENSGHLSVLCGLTFGKDTNPTKIRKMIESHTVASTFNDKFNKCRAIVENRLANSPLIGSKYFSVMLSDEMRQARTALAEEEKAKLDKAEEEVKKPTEGSSDTSSVDNANEENVIKVDFTKGNS